jgi:translation initiation factor 1A
MPNVKGGKGYKKGKGSRELEFVEAEEGQLYARVTKILGSCNLIVYCNDNEKRLAHIRGKLRKRVWINVGDIILVTTREFEKHDDETAIDPALVKMERCDVIAKYDHDMWGRLKKLDGFNQRLLIDVERVDQGITAAELESKLKAEEDEEDIFDHDGEEEEEEEVDSDEDPEVAAARKEAMKKRSEKKRMAIQDARSTKQKEVNMDNINIDEI